MPPSPSPLPPGLQAELLPLLQARGVLGAAIVLVDAAGPTGALSYGQADGRRRSPMTASTCLPVGAVSKTFTAMLAMRLSDQGKVSLDDPIATDLQPAAPARCPGRVTLGQLLEHTAGIDGPGRPLAWCPGRHYRDSDAGISLAAQVLERAGGADFDTLMQREVFDPLGTTAASFKAHRPPACEGPDDAIEGKVIDDDVPMPSSSPTDRAANALIASPLDLARVLQMLIRYGNGPAGNVLEPCDVAHMTVGTTGLAGKHGAVAGAYGKGLTRFVAGERPMIGHDGRVDGVQTSIGYAPETGQGLVIMVRATDEEVLRDLRDVVATHLWRGIPPPPLPPLTSPEDHVAGWYAKARPPGWLPLSWPLPTDLVRLEADAAGLAVRGLWPWQTVRRVLAVTDHSFRDEAQPLASMAFARDAEGRRWWTDGESHGELTQAELMTYLLVWAGAMMIALALPLWAIRAAVKRVVRRDAGVATRPGAGAEADTPIKYHPRKTALRGRRQWSSIR